METHPLSCEQGPIRPPNEARSPLLRITRNCPWNQCLFCPVYKKRRFSLRSVDEIRQDIEIARHMADEIQALSQQMGFGGRDRSAGGRAGRPPRLTPHQPFSRCSRGNSPMLRLDAPDEKLHGAVSQSRICTPGSEGLDLFQAIEYRNFLAPGPSIF